MGAALHVHGFRYVEISGLKEAPAEDGITGIVLNSDITRTGEWASNVALLNQLQNNIWWGQKGNFLEAPTDCPQRDERLGWTGDAQVFARTAAFNADVAGFFAKWQRDIRDAQHKNGSIPPIVPDLAPLSESMEDAGPAWSDATIICPWTNYLVYGDKRVLEDNYESFVRYLQHLDDISRPHGLIRSHPDMKGFGGFGDWLSTDTQDTFGTTRIDLIGTAFFAYSSQLLSKVARVLEKKDDAQKYEALFEEIKAAFNARFVTPHGFVAGGTQTSYVLALHFDLLPQELRSVAVEEW
jgi:alpha-L-rhamnosidase